MRRRVYHMGMDTTKRPQKLLGVNTDAKTTKGTTKGVLTGIMYLAPHKLAGDNICPLAELAGCVSGCLNTAGRGRFTNTQLARIRKTRLWHEERDWFMNRLRKDISALVRKANRLGMTPMVRLNGTSDIRWEVEAPELFAEFSEVQFYDYTKIPNRKNLPANYHLTFSYSGASERYREFYHVARDNGMNVAVVFRKFIPETFLDMPVINGDESDVRPFDPTGVVVALKAKGKAKQDTSGFVVDAEVVS
jgi:hypothetical protein